VKRRLREGAVKEDVSQRRVKLSESRAIIVQERPQVKIQVVASEETKMDPVNCSTGDSAQ